MARLACCFVWCGFVAVVMAGCGSGSDEPANRPQVYPVTGKVTYDGKPLEGAHVSFIPQGTEPGAFGVTDATGAFSLRTFEEGDGAASGQYTVTVIKHSKPEVDDSEVPDIAAPPKQVEVISLIPERYGNATTSGLSAQVTADGPNNFDFVLEK